MQKQGLEMRRRERGENRISAFQAIHMPDKMVNARNSSPSQIVWGGGSRNRSKRNSGHREEERLYADHTKP